MPNQRILEILIRAKDNASKELGKIGGILEKNKQAIRNAGIAMTAFGGAVSLGMKKAVDEAKVAEGTYNKFNTVFGEHSEDMMSFVKDLRKEMPLATHEIARLGADMQDLLVPMGLSRGLATDMSQGFLDVANKIAAFNDADPSDVLEAIKSGIAGSAEPLKRYGVNALETSLEARALKMGLLEAGQGFKDLEPEVKVQIRAQALLAQVVDNSSDAINGFEKNNDSLLRRQQDLQANMKELSKTIGDFLIPIFDAVVKKMLPIVNNMIAWIKEHPKLSKWIFIIVGALGALMVVLGPLLIILPGLISFFGIMATAIGLLLSPIGLVVAAIIGLVAAILYVWKHWEEFKSGALLIWETIAEAVEKAWNKIKEIILGVWEKIKKPIEAVTGFVKNTGSKIKSGIEGVKEGASSLLEKAGLSFDKGGIVPGPTGAPVPAIVHGGEMIIPADKKVGGNNFSFNFAGAFIGNIEEFKKQLISSINRDAELRSVAGE